MSQDLYSHNPTALLNEIVACSRAKEAAIESERERRSRSQHKARMEGFRAWVRMQSNLSETEKAEMIKASFTWC